MTALSKLNLQRCAAATVVVIAALTTSAGVAAASGSGAVPFTDPKQNGLITLCNAASQPMTSGSLTTVPFSAKAISSTPAPKGYRHGLATLLAYQPIQGIAPGYWSGEQLDAGSYFTNAMHPAAVSDIADRRLLDFAQAFPPHWDGLVQLRLLYTSPGVTPYYLHYPTAVIRVSGNVWTMVQGGNASCSASGGKPFSDIALGTKGIKQLARRNGVRPTTPATSSSSGTVSPGSSTTGSPSSNVGPSARVSKSTTAHGLSEAADGSGLGSGAKAAIGLGVLAILALGCGTWLARRRSGAEG